MDLRGDIGGAIDQLPYVAGDFLGLVNNAFYFYHQGNFLPYSTASAALPHMDQFKKIVILLDNQTQSSSEVLASTFKRAKFGITIGMQTRGWGSIEKVFPLTSQIDLNQTYSVFLVHTLTLADDNQPIEGRGIQPEISVNDKDWQSKLAAYSNDPVLIKTIKDFYNK